MSEVTRGTIVCSIQDFLMIWNRALNTLDPKKAPAWVYDLADRLADTDKPVEILLKLKP